MVISIGLPLLMVKGQFHSLNSMTVENLETFLPFLVKCSINKAGAQLINGVPEWWSSIIKFEFPLQKPTGLSNIGYLKHLSALVYRCYLYHKAQYLLSFSAKIAANPESVLLRNNDDNTTSIFVNHDLDHVVKFNNENKNYDAQEKLSEKTPKKLLLSPLTKKNTSIPDIYLCENCDAEFFSHAEMLKHEKVCYEIVIVDEDEDEGDNNYYNKNYYLDSNKCSNQNFEAGKKSHNSLKKNNKLFNNNKRESNDSNSSEEIEIIKHIRPNANSIPLKDKLFNYLGLEQNSNINLAKLKRYAFESPSKYRLKTPGRYFVKNENIEFSSNYGRKMLEIFHKHPTNSKINRNIFWYEFYCGTKMNHLRDLKSSSGHKVTPKKRKKTIWCHEYTFGKKERIKKLNKLKTDRD